MRPVLSRRALVGAGLGLGLAEALRAQPEAAAPPRHADETDDPQTGVMWGKLHRQLFGNRPVQLATAAELALHAPRRAADPAFVPLAVSCGLPRTAASHVKRLALLIDDNPSPIAALIDLPLDGAWPDLETRVRVDQYTFVRAVAEMNDGRLYMSPTFVKASGGCSAAPGTDAAAAQTTLGRMRFQTQRTPPWQPGQPLTVQWMISHPNASGMVMDAYTRQYAPAEYVRNIRLWQGQRLLLSADVDFALSENPSLRFRFVPQGDAPLRAAAIDTRDRHFGASIELAALLR